MINDELLSKFDRLEELPVSEEMLGAYIEGNLDTDESEIVAQAIDGDLFALNTYYDILNDGLADAIPKEDFTSSAMIDTQYIPLIDDEILDTISIPEECCESVYDDLPFNIDNPSDMDFDNDEDLDYTDIQ